VDALFYNSTQEAPRALEQLFSYQHGNLCGIDLSYNDLTGWELKNVDMTDGNFRSTNLHQVDFTGSRIDNANFTAIDGQANNFSAAQLYSTASYQIGLLGKIDLSHNNLSGWDLSNINMAYANLESTNLEGVVFDGAHIDGINLSHQPGDTNNLTALQMYSTASYQAGLLGDINLSHNDLSDWDLSNINLINANLESANLDGVNFNGADIQGVNFYHEPGDTNQLTAAQIAQTGSYQTGQLQEINFGSNDLSGLDLSGQDLTNTNLDNATLIDVDFTDAVINGTSLNSITQHGFTAEQFYSTANYKTGELSGLQFSGNDMSGWNLRDLNFTNALFVSNNGVSDMTGANLSRTDTRGVSRLPAFAAIRDNMIFGDGHIDGLILHSEETMLIRDYSGGIAITVDDGLIMAADATLEIVLADDDWGSTITLDLLPSTFADLDGTLFLNFADQADVHSLVGTTFDLFNWNGFLAAGDTFGNVAWPVGFDWDLSDLYASGTVTLLKVPEPSSILLLLVPALYLRRR
jgi:uncharacterized protein YjbI with pentapeptide repeats